MAVTVSRCNRSEVNKHCRLAARLIGCLIKGGWDCAVNQLDQASGAGGVICQRQNLARWRGRSLTNHYTPSPDSSLLNAVVCKCGFLRFERTSCITYFWREDKDPWSTRNRAVAWNRGRSVDLHLTVSILQPTVRREQVCTRLIWTKWHLACRKRTIWIVLYLPFPAFDFFCRPPPTVPRNCCVTVCL